MHKYKFDGCIILHCNLLQVASLFSVETRRWRKGGGGRIEALMIHLKCDYVLEVLNFSLGTVQNVMTHLELLGFFFI